MLKLRRYASIDGWEGALTVKERMMANGAEGRKEEQEWGIGSKMQESGSLCDAFLLFSDYANFSFFSFCFRTSRKEGGYARRSIEGSELGLAFHIYFCPYD